MAQLRQLSSQEVTDGERGIRDADYSATQVQAMVRNMDVSKKRHARLKASNPAAYAEKVKNENEILYYNYPSLFQMHIEDRMDARVFEMLQLKRKIERGEMTQEQATAIIGAKLYKDFAAPVVEGTAPPAPPMSYGDYYKKLGDRD